MTDKRILALPTRVVAYLENSKVSIFNYIATFLAIFFVRYFVEAFSQRRNYFNLPSLTLMMDMIHFLLAYVALLFMLALMLYAMLKVPMRNILAILLVGAAIMILGPLLDIIISGGEGVSIYYNHPEDGINLIKSFLTYFGGIDGVSMGLKIEIGFILLGMFIYARVHSLSYIKSLLVAIFAYAIILFWGSSPCVVRYVLTILGVDYNFSTPLMINYFLMVDIILFLIIGYYLNASAFMVLVKDMRASRILYYELNLLFGMALCLSVQFASPSFYVYKHINIVPAIILAMISVFFGCLYSLIVNNLNDIKIDQISNPSRPLVAGSIDVDDYRIVANIALFISFFYALMSDAKTVLVVGSLVGSYYIYSSPPIRFKRAFIFSKAVIGLNAFSLVVLGFVLAGEVMFQFPGIIAVIYLIGISLAANFIDLKDVEGDKAEGIMTLPILLGIKPAKCFIGSVFVLLSLAFYFVFSQILLLPVCVLMGVLFYYNVNRHDYKDWRILALCNIGLVFMIAYLLLEKTILG